MKEGVYGRGLRADFNWVAGAGVVTGALNFLAMTWFARELGPFVMGEYAAAITMVQLIAAFLSAGVDQAIIRDPGNAEIGAAAACATLLQSVILIVTVITTGALMFSFNSYESGLNGTTIPAGMVVVSVVLTWFYNLQAAPSAARLEYRFLSLVKLITTVAGVVFAVLLAMYGWGVYSLLMRDIVVALLMLYCIRRKNRVKLQWRSSRAGWVQLAEFARGLWGLNILERVALRLDHLLVGVLLGKELLGMYFVVRGLVEGLLKLLVSPIQTVLYSYYCRLQDESRLSTAFSTRLVLGYVGLCTAAAGLAASLSELAVSRTLGIDYLEVHSIIPSLAVYALTILCFENLKVYCMAQRRHHILVVARFAQLSFLLLVILPLSAAAGVSGIGMATASAAVVLLVVAAKQAAVVKGT